jgi:hypothetical protein
MKLDDILSTKAASPAQDYATLFLNGALEPDTDKDYFRLYRDPNNRGAYLLIRKADVTTEVYEWTAEETGRAGFVGTSMYRVPLRYGCEILVMSVAVKKLGETIARDYGDDPITDPPVCTVNEERCVNGRIQRCLFGSLTGPYWHQTNEKCGECEGGVVKRP